MEGYGCLCQRCEESKEDSRRREGPRRAGAEEGEREQVEQENDIEYEEQETTEGKKHEGHSKPDPPRRLMPARRLGPRLLPAASSAVYLHVSSHTSDRSP